MVSEYAEFQALFAWTLFTSESAEEAKRRLGSSPLAVKYLNERQLDDNAVALAMAVIKRHAKVTNAGALARTPEDSNRE